MCGIRRWPPCSRCRRTRCRSQRWPGPPAGSGCPPPSGLRRPGAARWRPAGREAGPREMPPRRRRRWRRRCLELRLRSETERAGLRVTASEFISTAASPEDSSPRNQPLFYRLARAVGMFVYGTVHWLQTWAQLSEWCAAECSVT